MPELPEVETVRRGLEEALKARPKITQIEFMRKDLRDPTPIKKSRALWGRRLLALRDGRNTYFYAQTKEHCFLTSA